MSSMEALRCVRCIFPVYQKRCLLPVCILCVRAACGQKGSLLVLRTNRSSSTGWGHWILFFSSNIWASPWSKIPTVVFLFPASCSDGFIPPWNDLGPWACTETARTPANKPVLPVFSFLLFILRAVDFHSLCSEVRWSVLSVNRPVLSLNCV